MFINPCPHSPLGNKQLLDYMLDIKKRLVHYQNSKNAQLGGSFFKPHRYVMVTVKWQSGLASVHCNKC